jgi:outer membrane lipoprotein-sorting protein
MRDPGCELHRGRGPRAVCILHLAFCVAVLTSSCARTTLTLPTGGGTPIADAAAVHAEVSRGCAGVRTLTAELALSGRAGGQGIRGRAVVGFERPDAMRLEGVAPIGPPAFILVSTRGDATLLLPRDGRVLRGARPEEILGALTGVALAPADLQAILTGCVVPSATVASASQLGEWVVLELDGGATLYLRRDRGALQVRAARRDGWQIEYAAWQGAFPGSVRLVSTREPRVDVTAQISQFETNVDLDAAAFAVQVPADTAPITLDELRAAGPLKGAASSR